MRRGRGVSHPPPSSAEVKGRIELYLYSLSGPSWPVLGRTQRKSITRVVKKAYELCFGCIVGNQDKSWAPHSCCSRCSRYLRGWLIGTHQSMRFAVPMVRREQKDHLTDCYFCLTKICGHNSKSKHTLVYPNIPSAQDLLNMTIPCQFLSHLNNRPCIKYN